jgi:hypothetical protein
MVARPVHAGVEQLEARTLLSVTPTPRVGLSSAATKSMVSPVLMPVTVPLPVPLPMPLPINGVLLTPASGLPMTRVLVPRLPALTPMAARPVPGVPTGLTGIPGDGRVTLTWTPPASNGGPGISDYVVQFRPNAVTTWTTFADGVSAAAVATVTGLTNGVSYVFRVAAVSVTGTGGASVASAPLTPVAPLPPSTPIGMAVASSTDASVTLSWNDVSGESGYRIERSSNYAPWAEVGRRATDATQFTDTLIEELTSYRYRVIAVNAAGASAPSDIVAVEIGLHGPERVVATVVHGGRIDLSWVDRSSCETGYVVEQFDDSTNTWMQAADAAVDSGGTSITGSFAPNTTYHFRVRAVIAWSGYTQAFSNDVEASVSTPDYPPAPGGVAATAFVDSVRLSWDPRAAVSVIVQRESEGSDWTTVTELVSPASSYEDDFLEASTAYVYRIAFRNAQGTSGFSESAAAVTAAGPSVAAAYRSTEEAFVRWTSPLEGVSGIFIERASVGSDAWARVGRLDSTATGYADTHVAVGTSYRYRIGFERWAKRPFIATSPDTGPEPKDADNDQLIDGEELAIGTNPHAFSTDSDLLGDGFERSNGLDPLDGDEDGDGVSDQYDDFDGDALATWQEVVFGTSTSRADADADGRPDGADSDGDGASDGVEVSQGSDPASALDGGQPPTADARIKLRVTVGDPSDSHSEQWALRVGQITHMSPTYGVVGSGDYFFDAGKSYPITLQHQGSLYDTPDYDWYANIQPIDQWEFFVADDNTPLWLVGPYQGDWMSNTGARFGSLEAMLHVPRLDVDVDSRNDGGYAIPDDNPAEDRLESEGTTGKCVFASTGDIDQDGIVDSSDFEGIAGGRFMPMVVRLSSNLAEAHPSSISLSFDHDPALFRLWKPGCDAGTARTSSDVIPSGAWTDAHSLGLEPGQSIVVYVEALSGATAGPVPITTTLRVESARWNGTLQDTVHLLPVEVDLDVDSNNDGRIDPENGPAGTDDRIEPESSRGLVVPVYAEDSDRDGLHDTADFDGIAGRHFAPVKVGLSEGAALAWKWPIATAGSPDEDLPGLTFTFTFSDAGFDPPGGGRFRLWRKDAPSVRTEADLIRSGVPIAATELFAGQPFTTLEEYMRNHGTTTLYLEVVSPSSTYEPISVRQGGTGAWAHSTAADTVYVRGIAGTLDLDVDSNNDEGFGVPIQRSPWEEKLESHSYAIGKLVMQSSASLDDDVAKDRLAASFTPVVIELPKNLPKDAQTIGVKFAMDAIAALDSGEIRLWNRNMGPGLLSQDAAWQHHPLGPWAGGGHRVYFDKPYTLSQINYEPTTGLAVVYMDGHVATRNVKLNEVEQGVIFRGILQATLTFDAPNDHIPLADDTVQYTVIRDDFFYHDFQAKPEVRSALASRGSYSFADLPNLALRRLSQDELQALFGEEGDSGVIDMLYTNLNAKAYPGFKSILYQDFAAKEDNTFILAFAGTDDTAGEFFNGKGYDWAENVCQALGWDSFQYQYAMQVATAIQEATKKLGAASFSTTGHSLGGGLASAASVVTGATGITFNAAGLHTNTLRKFLPDPLALNAALARYNQAHGLISAIRVDLDFLTHVQTIGSPFGVPKALGASKVIDGPYDRDAAMAGVTSVLVPGVGGILGAVWLAASQVKAHLMPAVLWGLLVTEGINGTLTRDTLGYDSSRL